MKTSGLVLLLMLLAVTACGSQPNAKVQGGVIEIRSGTTSASLRKSVLGIKPGTSASEVRQKLGRPFARVPLNGQSCWAYHASQPGTPLDALDFCMNNSQSVVRILTGVHL